MRSALLLFVLIQLIRRSESSGNIDLQQKDCPEGSDCGLGLTDSTLRALICLQGFRRRQNSLPRHGLTLYQLPPERNRWVGSSYLSHLRLTYCKTYVKLEGLEKKDEARATSDKTTLSPTFFRLHKKNMLSPSFFRLL